MYTAAGKDPAINQAKHGVSLALAEVLIAGPHLSITASRAGVRPDQQSPLRVRLHGPGEERRLISLRKANRREVKRYGETLE
jgi:uncharacterized DUF497 family protein